MKNLSIKQHVTMFVITCAVGWIVLSVAQSYLSEDQFIGFYVTVMNISFNLLLFSLSLLGICLGVILAIRLFVYLFAIEDQDHE